MMPFYKNISDIIPFDVDQLIDSDTIVPLTEIPVEDNFVNKNTLPSDVLNSDFYDFLKEKDLIVDRIIIWTWYCKNPHWAHIDSNSQGVILESALNWTLNHNKSRVHFYDMPDVDKTVMFGNQIDTGWSTPNVTAYIPVNVKGIDPVATWDNRGPAIINTSVPHLIVAEEIRTSCSLQFNKSQSIETLYKKLYD